MQGLPLQTFQEKSTDKYTIRVPDDNHDLHMQLYFKEPFKQMVTSKKVFKILKALEKELTASDLEGEFELELYTETESIYLGSRDFWDSLVTDIGKLIALVEKVLDKMC